MKINEITNNIGTTKTVKRVSGSNVELQDPKQPGIKTTIDLKKTKVSQNDKGETVIEPQDKINQKPQTLKPNAKVSLKGFDGANK